MIAVITKVLLFAAPHGDATSGFQHFYNEWLNIPGFEAWKFFNLALFLIAMIYIGRKHLSPKFKEKRDAIRAELIRAENEKKAALERLTAIEAKLAQLESEKRAIEASAVAEAEADEKELLQQTEADIARLKAQARAELDRLADQARSRLRRRSAEESVMIAEQRLRLKIDGPIDGRLVKNGIAEIGGLN